MSQKIANAVNRKRSKEMQLRGIPEMQRDKETGELVNPAFMQLYEKQ